MKAPRWARLLSASVAIGAMAGFGGISRASADAQSEQHAGHTHASDGAPSSLPLVIDGSREPERIPDSLAYHHFIKSIAIPAGSSPGEVARRNAFVNRIGLPATERLALIKALEGTGDGLQRVKAARQAITADVAGRPETNAKLAELKQQERVTLDNARLRVQTTLTATSLQQLETHLREHVKRRIKVYGDPTAGQ